MMRHHHLLAVSGVLVLSSLSRAQGLGDDRDLGLPTQQPAAAVAAVPPGRTMGVGLQVGAPTALTLKLGLAPDSAVVVGLGGGWSANLGAGLELSVGYVVHPATLLDFGGVALGWYAGLAVDLLFQREPRYALSHPYVVAYDQDKNGGGVHLPLGLELQPRAFPLAVFAEMTPGMDLYPMVGPRLGAACGLRWFI